MHWPVKVIRTSFYLLFILVPLIFLPSTSELFEFNKMVVTYFLTSTIAASWIAHMILSRRVVFHRTPLDLPLVIFLLIQFVSLLLSLDPRTSLFGYYSRFNGGLLSLLCYSLLYWAAVTYLDSRSTKIALVTAAATAALVSLWGFAEHFGIDASWWVQDVQTRVFSTLGQPNWLAAYLVALIFLPLSVALATSRHRLSALSLTLLMFLVLVFTKSRSGLLAFAVASVVFWLPQLISRSRSGLSRTLFFAVNAGFLVLLLLFPHPVKDQLLSRLPAPDASSTSTAPTPSSTSLETGGTESGVIRKIVWTGALRIWQASPKNFWLGSGPETFAMAYYQHRPLEHNTTSEWELLYNKAHNEFLNFLSTTGLLGFISYLMLLFVMGHQLYRHSSRSPLHLALLAGWISLSITNFWGFSVVIVQICLFLFPALSLALTTPPPPPQSASPTTTQAWMILALAISPWLYLSYSLLNYWVADTSYASGQKYLKAFNATQNPQYILNSYESLTRAYQLNPHDAPISSELAISAAFMSVLAQPSDTTAAAQLAQIADAASQRAISDSPAHPNYYKNRSRAMLLLATYDPHYFALSDAALAQATLISPTDPRIPYIRGINAKYAQNASAAAQFFQASLHLKPDLADSINQLQDLASPSAPPIP